MPRPSSAAGSASRGARAPLLLVVLVANRDGRKRARALDVPIPACMWVRSTPDQQAGARRHDARRRDAAQKMQPLGTWGRMRGAGSEEMCALSPGENHPPRLLMRRLRARDWCTVQPALAVAERCGNVVAVDGCRNARCGGWFFPHREANVSLGKPSSASTYRCYSRALVLPKTHRS